MKKLFVAFLAITIQFSYSQREANVWCFGQGAGLDFNSCEPIAISSSMDATEGCASIADSSGILQFYTEGTTIWNRNHVVMANGNGLLGHKSTTQSSMIVKRPGNTNEYYVFTLDEIGNPNGLRYSVVNMNSNGGLGTVTTKNVFLLAPTVEKIHATRHANGDDIWVAVHGFNNNSFYAFLVTSAGINTTPVISNVGPVISGNNGATVGAMKFSPNGKKLAICNYEEGVGLFDFNNSNGKFSNSKYVYSKNHSYGVEFSKSSDILYVTTSNKLVDNKLLQFDLNASVIEDSKTTINDDNFVTKASLQLGPDNKIYVSTVSNSLSVINEPNNLGNSCDFVKDAIPLNGRNSWAGLPLFIFPISHNKIGFEETCFGDATQFRLNDSVNAVTWDFGDPASGINNTSTDLEPKHVFSSPGIYMVTTSIPSGCGPTPTITEQVEIFGLPTVQPTVELIQCDDDSNGFSDFNLSEANSKISANYENEVFTYYESQIDAENRTNIISSSISYTNKTAYSDTVWARIENINGCYEISQINLKVSKNDAFDSFSPIIFNECDDNTPDGITTFDFRSAETSIKTLFPGQIDITYFKNITDALAETNRITDISFYTNTGYPYTQDIYVRVDDKLNNSCVAIGGRIILNVIEQPQFELDEKAVICANGHSNVTITAYNPKGIYSYEWTDPDGTVISSDISATVNKTGLYTLIATATNGCKSFPKHSLVSIFENPVLTMDMVTIEGFSSNNTISIDETKLGTGDYEYALNDEFGLYQEAPFFQNIPAGVHTLFVRDKNNCDASALEISILGYPKFFTPNNDGYNDTWNIMGINDEYSVASKVYIYDRYGKLLTEINPSGRGWDGLFNGKASAPSDYWFVAKLVNQSGKIEILRGHFSLVR